MADSARDGMQCTNRIGCGTADRWTASRLLRLALFVSRICARGLVTFGGFGARGFGGAAAKDVVAAGPRGFRANDVRFSGTLGESPKSTLSAPSRGLTVKPVRFSGFF
jgi:hypothetical protein